MARDRRRVAATSEDSSVGGDDTAAAVGTAAAAVGVAGGGEGTGEEAQAAHEAVADAIARIEAQHRPGSAREVAVTHAARESMAAIDKFLGVAAVKGNPGRNKFWVGRLLKHRVKAWQLVYDFDADYSYVARMDRGIYLTARGKVLFTVADSRPTRRHVAWKCDGAKLDTYLTGFAAEHDASRTPMLHHRRLLEGIARICAEQQLDWR